MPTIDQIQKQWDATPFSLSTDGKLTLIVEHSKLSAAAQQHLNCLERTIHEKRTKKEMVAGMQLITDFKRVIAFVEQVEHFQQSWLSAHQFLFGCFFTYP